jgi:hypothetical protein
MLKNIYRLEEELSKTTNRFIIFFSSLFGGFSVRFLWNEPNSEPTSKYRIDEESARSEIFILLKVFIFEIIYHKWGPGNEINFSIFE